MFIMIQHKPSLYHDRAVGDVCGWMLYDKVLLLAVLTNLTRLKFLRIFFYSFGVKIVMKYNEGLCQFISQLSYGESFRYMQECDHLWKEFFL